ncbi:hypothetical protein PHYBLDRAFT_60048 [Phycomyces blakesleeanus NRRL 1555(-)]|uniref:PCI domain-containing protein n=1 Tax=Phycomyces blakesleeanus (strain ATCC 8743b / DSM 1359 / FGSC 10004 / NBRC 33097 / NRRL 1555) TaxID=763407 RepID=A0A167LCM5_PHYB8|nr:hypothetical protein PHYBLDRAFT_60048 [Phycomyces blakesleeanus NRRL 1555(-)]OAD70148.1 hypothetical protein PHYBLDRAFT_60048 [Phycomyces blakesleeanus NRRL 1555(-)]|eukprot:XP_018288188.1 hypothetical protein PHYBLDRAFT_60048 [Phycomyces blakesleeanus NRRL 1555(-)]
MCKRLDAPWDDMTASHIRAALYFDQGAYLEAFDAQKEVVQSFQRSMPSLTRWCLPILYVINNDLRNIALKADEDSTLTGQRKKLEEAANIINLQKSQLKQRNLCKNILRALKAAEMPPLQSFPKSDRVTFRFYLGKLYFLEEDYPKARLASRDAENELSLAFRECTKASQRNKELILEILLPIRLMHGVVPKPEALARFPRLEQLYGPLTAAMKRGNVREFDECLVTSEQELIRQGTYLAVEKAQSIAMRQLFRKVFIILDSNTRIPIALFKKALDFVGMDVGVEECEWMLATMIYKGYIKGYLSHEKSFLVLSKADPFPAINSSSV